MSKLEKIKIECTLYKFGRPYFCNSFYLKVGDCLEDCKMSFLYKLLKIFSSEEDKMIASPYCFDYKFNMNGKLVKMGMCDSAKVNFFKGNLKRIWS